MKRALILFILICCGAALLKAQGEALIQNVYNRTTVDLNGEWSYIIDPYENGYYNYRYEPFDQQETPWASAFFLDSKPKDATDLIEYSFAGMDRLKVPGDWNSQRKELLYYEGTIWYKRAFDYSLADSSNRLFVYFEAANYKAEVYFNGKKLGQHLGGFTPFNFEITHLLQEKDNFLIVKLDNKRLREGVPTLNTDWWNYGGLTREVRLVETPATFVQDYFFQLSPEDSKKIEGYVQLNGANRAQRDVRITIPELGVSLPVRANEEGYASVEIVANNIKYWSLEVPHLYDLAVEIGEERVHDQVGFRSIKTEGTQILLNGRSVFLRGISIHEESPLRDGRGYSKEDARQLLEWAQELGCNYVRLAHYPHNEHMVRLADEMGILVWEENPVYWTIDWENPATYQNAANQLSELIARDKNRASVVIWSMANETPNVAARNVFLNKLAAFARSKDATRLISAALEQKDYEGNPAVRTISDPFAEVVDILSFNQYIGWYDGLPEKCQTISWKIDQDKPVVISEFGAGAKQGLHGSKTARWTEEYQAYLYEETLSMIDRIDQLQGVSPWILVDFRSPRRVLPVIQDGWNRKGLISDDGKKKKAFFVLGDYYNAKAKQE
ncbi:MAG: glycoside hydrolase family 2 TIM barrel-domain containing protein [Bacteroidota bacterium]